MTGEREEVVIYEPNALNPYGAEVARIIAGSVSDPVRLVVQEGRDLADLGAVIVDARLESSASRAGLPRRILARVVDPVATSVGAGSAPLVVIWTRDGWDAFVFRLRAAAGAPVVVVHHNPVAARERRGMAGWAERSLRRRATVVVTHSPELAALSRTITRRSAVVAPHPAYSGLLRSVGSQGAVHRGPHGRLQVALVGALRADKGGDLLPAIAAASGGGWDLLVLGPDRFTTDVEGALQEYDVVVTYPDQQPATDEQLIEGLRRTDVVLAPYVQMTESGSVILAVTAGTSVLGLDSIGLRRLLLARSCAANAKELGRLLDEFRRGPWETNRLTAQQLDVASTAGWRAVLATATARSRRRS